MDYDINISLNFFINRFGKLLIISGVANYVVIGFYSEIKYGVELIYPLTS